MIESNVSLSCAWCAGGGDGTRAHLDENHSEHSLSPTGHLVVAVCLGFIGTFGFLNNTLVLILFLSLQSAALAHELSSGEHLGEWSAGVRPRHSVQLRRQYAGPVAHRTRGMRVVRLHQFILGWVCMSQRCLRWTIKVGFGGTCIGWYFWIAPRKRSYIVKRCLIVEMLWWHLCVGYLIGYDRCLLFNVLNANFHSVVETYLLQVPLGRFRKLHVRACYYADIKMFYFSM